MENLHTSILTIKALKIVIPIAIVLAVFVIKLVLNRSQKRIVCYEDEQAYTAAEGENEPQNQYCDDEEDDYDPEKEKAESRKNIEKFTKQLESAQTNERKAELYCCRSQAYSSLDMYSQATEDINAAIALCPQNDHYYYKRADLLLVHDDNKALQDITTAISLAPKNAAYYDLRAVIYLLTPQNFDKALEDFTTVIDFWKSDSNISASDTADAYFGRGRIYFYLKQYDNVLQDVTKSIELIYGQEDILSKFARYRYYLLRARTYCAEGNFDAAIKDYDFLVENDEYGQEQWILERAQTYLKKGDKAKAKKEFSKLTNSDSPTCALPRAEAFQTLGKPEKALEVLNTEEDNTKNIIEEYKECATNDFDSHFVEIYFLRGEVYQELKEHDKALEDYKRSIEYYEKIFARNKSELDIYDQIRYNNCLNRITEITGRKHKLNN